MMKDGVIEDGRSYGSESVGNVEFARNEGGSRHRSGTKSSLSCARCDTRKGVTRASSGKTRNVRKRVKNSPNLQARRPRAVHGKGGAARDVTSESEEDETEGVKCGARKYGVSLLHTLCMLDEATTRVEGRWCTPYRRSRKSSILNLRI